MTTRLAPQTLNVAAIAKTNGERYVFLYDDASRQEMLRLIGRYASDPELSFSWYDAARITQKIRANT